MKKFFFILLGILIFLCLLDSITAYLNARFHPQEFLKYEQNPLAVHAYYYHQWEYLLLKWAYVSVLVGVVFVIARVRGFILASRILFLWILFSLGGAASNVVGIFAPAHPRLAAMSWLVFVIIGLFLFFNGGEK